MFANLLHLFQRRTSSEEYDLAFVKEVRTTPPEPRSRRSEWVLIVGWLLIVAKCVGVWWLISAYKVPVNPWWVIAPTLGAAAVCTGLYIWRH